MHRFAVPFLSSALALVPAAASADVIDPREDACGGKEVGDACDAGGQKGFCTESTCSKNDYSEGVPPKTKSYDCLLCQPGPRPEPEADAPPETPDATKPVAEPSEPPVSATETDKPKNKSGCSVGGDPFSIASVALGLLALGWVARRRSQA